MHQLFWLIIAFSALWSGVSGDSDTTLTTLEVTKVTKPMESTKETEVTEGITGKPLPKHFRWSRIGSRSIQLGWDDHTINGATLHFIYLIVQKIGATTPHFSEQVEFTDGSVTVDGLQPDTVYIVRLSAFAGTEEHLDIISTIKTLKDGEEDITNGSKSSLTYSSAVNFVTTAALLICMPVVLA
ncbi:unnamed protein product [Hydatigera taeniaeformis]|uniref:Fibronectin type-III domain-containing protein n=1 Tax=Hydatigena taeniaeformis TaxID=6205 RepID=A0A0R3XCY1_HYDTA|nr:unnamed protein product [Hydatigera taeniaeformis]